MDGLTEHGRERGWVGGRGGGEGGRECAADGRGRWAGGSADDSEKIRPSGGPRSCPAAAGGAAGSARLPAVPLPCSAVRLLTDSRRRLPALVSTAQGLSSARGGPALRGAAPLRAVVPGAADVRDRAIPPGVARGPPAGVRWAAECGGGVQSMRRAEAGGGLAAGAANGVAAGKGVAAAAAAAAAAVGLVGAEASVGRRDGDGGGVFSL